jgi:hypothetical protein
MTSSFFENRIIPSIVTANISLKSLSDRRNCHETDNILNRPHAEAACGLYLNVKAEAMPC